MKRIALFVFVSLAASQINVVDAKTRYSVSPGVVNSFKSNAFFVTRAQSQSDSFNGTKDINSTQYAVLYIYTTGIHEGHEIVDIDGTAVCALFSNSKFEIKLYKDRDRLVEVGGKSVRINVEFGKEYYLYFEVRRKAFHTSVKLNLIPTDEGKLAFSKTMSYARLKEPLLLCKKIQGEWNNLLEKHSELKSKFSKANRRPYFFDIYFIIDASGKLKIKYPNRFTPKTPEEDSSCFRVLFDVLQETQWNRSLVDMEGHAFFVITSKGFQSINMLERVYYPSFSTVRFDDIEFYSCNCSI